eukprot:784829-Amphidinium_carterae.1
MDWAQFTAKKKTDSTFAELVEKARAKRVADNHVDKGQAVESDVSVSFEVSKAFLVGNMSEVKKKLGVERVPARVLKFIPTMQLPNEQGETETVYVFAKEEEEGLRSAKLTLKLNTHHVRTHLGSAEFLDNAHTEEIMTHALSADGQKSGLTNLMNKLPWLQTFSAWEEKKAGGAEHDEGRSLEEAVQEASSELVGPAASFVAEAPAAPSSATGSTLQKFLTPKSSEKQAGLSRASSEEWSGSRASEPGLKRLLGSDAAVAAGVVSAMPRMSVAGTEEASTAMGEEGQPEKLPLEPFNWLCGQCPLGARLICGFDALHSETCEPNSCEYCFLLHRGDDTLAYWKTKLNLFQLALGKQDRRSRPALKRVVQRLSSKKETQADATILNGFVGQVGMAEQLAP